MHCSCLLLSVRLFERCLWSVLFLVYVISEFLKSCNYFLCGFIVMCWCYVYLYLPMELSCILSYDFLGSEFVIRVLMSWGNSHLVSNLFDILKSIWLKGMLRNVLIMESCMFVL